MSDTSKFVAESLAELITGIADGVKDAQVSLSSASPVDSFGSPVPRYHLPYVDFDIKVEMETTETTSGKRGLRILPMGNIQNKSLHKDVTSTVSGRFVAIPPGEGIPIPILQVNSTRLSARKHSIEVLASNSAGELLQNAQVEVNLNLELSQQLSSSRGITLNSLRRTALSLVVLETDEFGIASTELTVDSGVAAKASIVVSAEFAQRVVNVVVAAGNEA